MKKIEFETFRDIGPWEVGNLTIKEPASFNGFVLFRKYKVTVEEIEEPKDVLAERIQKLWDECDNFHQWRPLEAAAKSIGYKLVGTAGSKKIKP